MEQGHETTNFGVRGQRSRSREAEDRFGGLAEASFSTPMGRVAFVVFEIMWLLFN